MAALAAARGGAAAASAGAMASAPLPPPPPPPPPPPQSPPQSPPKSPPAPAVEEEAAAALVDLDLGMLLGRLGLQRYGAALRGMGAVSFEKVLLGQGGPAGVAAKLGLTGEDLQGWLEAFGED